MCSSAYFDGSQFLQAFLHEEKDCKSKWLIGVTSEMQCLKNFFWRICGNEMLK